jgi:predicted NBD/HSP70 family sugar kinase
MRQLNAGLTLRTLMALEEPITMADLVRRTRLSRRTLEMILTDAIADGWVSAADSPNEREVGRPARRFAFRADRTLIGAIRIDTHAATAILTDVRGRIVGRGSRLLREYADPFTSTADGAAALEAAIEDSGYPRERVGAGAAAIDGTIDEGGVVHSLPGVPAWYGFDVEAAFAAHFSVPFFADNDANLAALAEHWVGAARDHPTFAWVIAGNRTGVGLLIRGAVHRGVDGAAGELVNLAGMADRENNVFAMLTAPDEADRARARSQLQALRAGDERLSAELDSFSNEVADLLTVLAWTIAPPQIVLGGGLEAASDVLLPRLQAAMRARATPLIELVPTTIGDDAPLLGGVRLVLDRMDVDLFGPVVLE